MFLTIFGMNEAVLFISLFLLLFILIILFFVLLARTARLENAYIKYMRGANGKSLAESFASKFEELDDIKGQTTEIAAKVAMMESEKVSGFCKFASYKYDAFEGIGGKLSFSVCLLNSKNDGIILTGVHNTEGCYTYLRDVVNGKTFVKISGAEKKVLDEAIAYADPVEAAKDKED